MRSACLGQTAAVTVALLVLVMTVGCTAMGGRSLRFTSDPSPKSNHGPHWKPFGHDRTTIAPPRAFSNKLQNTKGAPIGTPT
eukprot:8648092-Pyramimonas_sp.AAC.1